MGYDGLIMFGRLNVTALCSIDMSFCFMREICAITYVWTSSFATYDPVWTSYLLMILFENQYVLQDFIYASFHSI